MKAQSAKFENARLLRRCEAEKSRPGPHPSLTMRKITRKAASRARRIEAMDRWVEEVAQRVEEADDEEQSAQLVHVRQQLDLLVQYQATCAKLQAFSKSLRDRGASLVPLRFPLRPTPRNRQSIEEGLTRSFKRFLEDLYVQCLTTNAQRLECLRHANDSPLVTRLTATFALASCRVLDREIDASQAVESCVSVLEGCRTGLIRAEREALGEVREACLVVAELMGLFCRRWSARKRSASRADTVMVGRAFLKTAARQGKGMSYAVHTLCKRRRMAPVFEGHAWMTRQYDGLTDDEVLDVCNRLVDSHVHIAQAVSWEAHRVEWLRVVSVANACWDGVALASSQPAALADGDVDDAAAQTWATDGAVLHAPAHMATFATLEQLRLVAEPQTAQFSCFLSTVRVTNVLLELLHSHRLVLNRISAEYAQRIAAFDFSKYESAGERIVADTLRPFGETVGVSFDG